MISTLTRYRKLYVDLDGVLFDLYGYFGSYIGRPFIPGATLENPNFFWDKMREHYATRGPVYRNLPLLPDARELWEALRPHNPEILSSHGGVIPGVDDEKRAAVAEHFGPDVVVNLVAKSHLKAAYAAPGVILIDDYTGSIDPFVAAGGTGVLHTSTRTTLAALEALGFTFASELSLPDVACL